MSAVALGSGSRHGRSGPTHGKHRISGVISATGNSGSSATPQTLSAIKARAKAAVTQRVKTLDAAIAEVNAASGLGSR